VLSHSSSFVETPPPTSSGLQSQSSKHLPTLQNCLLLPSGGSQSPNTQHPRTIRFSRCSVRSDPRLNRRFNTNLENHFFDLHPSIFDFSRSFATTGTLESWGHTNSEQLYCTQLLCVSPSIWRGLRHSEIFLISINISFYFLPSR
jgi:hypothetical protein